MSRFIRKKCQLSSLPGRTPTGSLYYTKEINNKKCLRSVSSLITGVQSVPSTCLGGLVQQAGGVGRDGGINLLVLMNTRPVQHKHLVNDEN